MAKRHSQFFLYLPAEGGKEWIEGLKELARKRGVSPSELIRKATDRYLSLERAVAEDARRAGVSRYRKLRQLAEGEEG